MSKYQLLLRAMVVIWLFWFGNAAIREYRTARQEYAIAKKEELRLNKYEIGVMGGENLKIPFILDKETGSVWKWFMSDNNAGFQQVNFFPSTISKELAQCQSDLAAYKELRQAQLKYPDLEEYRDEITAILNSVGSSMTIEEAYLKAKENRENLGK